jgi:hypothetical protein
MAKPPSPPTKEIGAQVNAGFTVGIPRGTTTRPWGQFIDDREYAPELVWPSSILTFDQMRNDSQVDGLYAGITWPIRRYRWLIDPNGAPDSAVAQISEDLNLDIKDEQPRNRSRTKGRFNFQQHIADAFLALMYGHYFFEQVGQIIDDPTHPSGQRWQLRKLAPREPRTISRIEVAEDGGLVAVQQLLNTSQTMFLGEQPTIPVDQLVAYVWDKEGAQWTGRSMLRSSYRNWLLKDKAMRIDIVNHGRAGGVPVITAPEGATPEEINRLSQMAQNFRVGENAGGAVPYGSTLDLQRGSSSPIIETMKYHDEQMARRFLMMVMLLGQTRTGSRALGAEFGTFFRLGQEAIAEWFLHTFNEHVIEDWMDWNYGEDEQYAPMLTYEISEEQKELATADLVQLISAGAIWVDKDLRDQLRDQYNLPQEGDDAQPPATAAPSPEGSSSAGTASGGGPGGSTAPSSTSSSSAGKTTAGVRAKRGREARSDGSLPADDLPPFDIPVGIAAYLDTEDE